MAGNDEHAGDCDRSYLVNLPNELLMMIVDHIKLFDDLTATSLTCKTLRAVAVLPLYRVLNIDLRDYLHRFESTNRLPDINVKHVRTLRFSDKGAEGDSFDNQKVLTQKVIKAILEAVPNNQLERLEWFSERVFHFSNLALLLRTQSNLRQLELFRLDGNPDSLFSTLREYDLRKVDKLILTASGPTNLTWGHYLILNAPKVSDLTIKVPNSRQTMGSVSQLPLDKVVYNPRSVLSELFNHYLTPGPSSTLPDPPSLMHLHLANITFFPPITVCASLFRIPSLSRLAITHCKGVPRFMGTLCDLKILPLNLKTLALQHGDDKDGEVVRALCRLLLNFTGLQTLVVDIGKCQDLPNPVHFNNHGQTLRNLVVHGNLLRWNAQYSNERVYNSNELKDLSVNCPRLEQLSIGVRPPVIGARYELPWGWNNMQNVVCAMDQLRVLHLTPSPYSDRLGELSGKPIPEKVYSARVARIVTDLLQLNSNLCSNPRLELIRLGRDRISPGFRAWLAVNSNDVYAKTFHRSGAARAKRVKLVKVRFNEPDNEIWKL